MTKKALVIEDDPYFAEEVCDVLDTLGHKHDLAGTFLEARKLIDAEQYDYYLVDLEIPNKLNRPASRQNGIQLITDLGQKHGPLGPPVLVVTGHGHSTYELAATTMRLGAVDYISKSKVQDGQLQQSIGEALRAQKQRRKTERRWQQEQNSCKKDTIAFQGGDMILEDEHVSLCGVRIVSDKGTGQCVMIFEALSRTDAEGNFVRHSGEDLIRHLGGVAELNKITGCIRYIRKNITTRLKERIGFVCKPEDVVAHDESGYFLRDWISVTDQRSVERIALDHDSAIKQPMENSQSKHRQNWILRELKRGVRVQRNHLEKRFGVSTSSAKRDFSALVKAKQIEYVNTTKPSYYRLCRRRQA